ncbi:MAG: hypothetical protein R3E82_12935 [Pseudomonadales bacterium]|nr:hypothetical protein [Pseudomonadales bacterium]
MIDYPAHAILEAMRYLLQIAIPASIIVVVVYLLIRNRNASRNPDSAATENTSDTGTFLLILIIGATVAVLSMFAVQEFWA